MTIKVTKGWAYCSFNRGHFPCLKSSDPILNNMPLRGFSDRETVDAAKLVAEMNAVRAANGRPLIVLA